MTPAEREYYDYIREKTDELIRSGKNPTEARRMAEASWPSYCAKRWPSENELARQEGADEFLKKYGL